jgi:predicted RNA polymerase sigma factor
VVSLHTEVEYLLRTQAPQVLAALVRRHWDFADAEDAVQEALIAAATQWPVDGVPGNPRGWLIAVAGRRLTDLWRADVARRHREDLVAAREPAVPAQPSNEDDSLELLFLCCHPVLAPSSAIPLTLRAVGGLATAEIAAAFLVPEDTMAKRISRAKQRIRSSGVPFRMPTPVEWDDRLRNVLHVLYLIFNEGYSASAGPHVVRVDLSTEAIRLTRALRAALPDEPEVVGLLALMLLTDARRPARTGPPANSSHCPNRTAPAGTRRSSPRESRCCPRCFPGEPSANTSCRPPSPPSTTRRPPPTRPTGRRSSPCTGCWNA